MRKMEFIYNTQDNKLVEEINHMYQKAEKLGYKIICTQIIKEPMAGFRAFVEYETTPTQNIK